jgi:hypothetical protein
MGVLRKTALTIDISQLGMKTSKIQVSDRKCTFNKKHMNIHSFLEEF